MKPKEDHIFPLLEILQWLPTAHRKMPQSTLWPARTLRHGPCLPSILSQPSPLLTLPATRFFFVACTLTSLPLILSTARLLLIFRSQLKRHFLQMRPHCVSFCVTGLEGRESAGLVHCSISRFSTGSAPGGSNLKGREERLIPPPRNRRFLSLSYVCGSCG